MTLLEMVLPANFDCTFRIKVDASATTPMLTTTPNPPLSSPTRSTVWSTNVEKMLVRMEKNGRTKMYPHRAVAEHLTNAGFIPGAQPDGKAYIRWHVDGAERGVTIYQEGSCLVVDSKPLLSIATTLAGGKKSPSDRPRVQWTYGASVDNALDAATKLREYADKK